MRVCTCYFGCKVTTVECSRVLEPLPSPPAVTTLQRPFPECSICGGSLILSGKVIGAAKYCQGGSGHFSILLNNLELSLHVSWHTFYKTFMKR